jgi:hypothetical protein
VATNIIRSVAGMTSKAAEEQVALDKAKAAKLTQGK